jgi:hypothetical protein
VDCFSWAVAARLTSSAPLDIITPIASLTSLLATSQLLAEATHVIVIPAWRRVPVFGFQASISSLHHSERNMCMPLLVCAPSPHQATRQILDQDIHTHTQSPSLARAQSHALKPNTRRTHSTTHLYPSSAKPYQRSTSLYTLFPSCLYAIPACR